MGKCSVMGVIGNGLGGRECGIKISQFPICIEHKQHVVRYAQLLKVQKLGTLNPYFTVYNTVYQFNETSRPMELVELANLQILLLIAS